MEFLRLQGNPGELPKSRGGAYTLHVAFPLRKMGMQFAAGGGSAEAFALLLGGLFMYLFSRFFTRLVDH